MSSVYSISPGATASLSATVTTGNVALFGTGAQIELQNGGAVTVFIALGGSAVVATVGSYPLLPGQSKIITRNPDNQTYIAAITASGSAAIYATVGEGM